MAEAIASRRSGVQKNDPAVPNGSGCRRGSMVPTAGASSAAISRRSFAARLRQAPSGSKLSAGRTRWLDSSSFRRAVARRCRLLLLLLAISMSYFKSRTPPCGARLSATAALFLAAAAARRNCPAPPVGPSIRPRPSLGPLHAETGSDLPGPGAVLLRELQAGRGPLGASRRRPGAQRARTPGTRTISSTGSDPIPNPWRGFRKGSLPAPR